MKQLKSKKYPGFEYEIDDELFEMGLVLDNQDVEFMIDIDETMTQHKDMVDEFSKQLDDIVNVKEKLMNQVIEIYNGEDSESKNSIEWLINYYLEEVDLEYQYKIFDVSEEEYKISSKEDLLRKNNLRRSGLTDAGEYEGQRYIVDLMYNPEYTDELLVLHLDKDLKILAIVNES